jgi:3-mercaptopyruvate sulfurtransferase SseA
MEDGRQGGVASITIARRRAALPALELPTLLGHGPDPMTVVRAPSVGRLPGARSIPLSSLGTRRGEIPSGPLVVLYGAEGLLAAGHANVFVLEGGFAAWRARGDDVER